MSIPIGLEFPASDLADPPVSQGEAMRAEPANCRIHGGLIGHGLSQGDWHGRVYYCPAGRMFWRLAERVSGMHSPLHFPKGL